jgi:hypothetical protein
MSSRFPSPMSNHQSALRLVPAPQPKSASIADTATALGLHDALQYGPRSLAAEVLSIDGFKERLEQVVQFALPPSSLLTPSSQWDETQDNLRLNIQRNVWGIHAPMRLLMERKLVSRVRLRLSNLSSLSPLIAPTVTRHPGNAPLQRPPRHPHGS